MATRRARRDAPAARGVRKAPDVAGATDELVLDELDDHETHAGVRCDGGVLVGRTVAGLSLRGALLTGCRLTGVVLPEAELTDVVLRDCDLSGADLTRAADAAGDVRAVPPVGAGGGRGRGGRRAPGRLPRRGGVVAHGPARALRRRRLRPLRQRLVRRARGADRASSGRSSTAASCRRPCSPTWRCTAPSLAGIRGADLRDVVIGSDQVVELAVALFATRNVVIDDEADAEPDTDHDEGAGAG